MGSVPLSILVANEAYEPFSHVLLLFRLPQWNTISRYDRLREGTAVTSTTSHLSGTRRNSAGSTRLLSAGERVSADVRSTGHHLSRSGLCAAFPDPRSTGSLTGAPRPCHDVAVRRRVVRSPGSGCGPESHRLAMCDTTSHWLSGLLCKKEVKHD